MTVSSQLRQKTIETEASRFGAGFKLISERERTIEVEVTFRERINASTFLFFISKLSNGIQFFLDEFDDSIRVE
jgi:hypothetical protein